MRNPFLVGKRLYLRPLEEGDVERCQRWINDPEVRRWITRRFPVGYRQEAEWLQRQYTSLTDIVLAIVLKEGDKHIGNCGLHKIDYTSGRAILGIVIGEPDYRGRGYGPEAMSLLLDYAFGELRLHRVELKVFSYNQRALRAYRKLGFREEGRKREAHFYRGSFHDIVIMGILEREWSERYPEDGV